MPFTGRGRRRSSGILTQSKQLVNEREDVANEEMTSGLTVAAHQLVKVLEGAIKCDSWGDRLEAAEQYRKVAMMYHNGSTNFCTDEKDEKKLTKVFSQINRRAGTLDGAILETKSQVPLDVIKEHVGALNEIIEKYESRLNRRHSSVIQKCGDKLLLPSKMGKPGQSMLTIKIEKIGLKDADKYVDPYFTVRVKDMKGEDICAEQNTPPSYHIQGQYILFDVNVHIPTPLDDIPKGYAIFFEFNHYKAEKDKVSCRCYSFVEQKEVKNGYAVVEIYKKPVDYNRKKLYLLTAKPLYLHLYYTISKK